MKRSLFFIISVLLFAIHSFGQLWKQYADSAQVYNDKKNTEKVVEFYGKEKAALIKDSSKSLTYALLCHDLGAALFSSGQYEKAISLFSEAIQIRGVIQGKKDLQYAKSCNGLASSYLHLYQYQKAEPFYLEAKLIVEANSGKNNLEYAQICNNLALLNEVAGQNEKAELLFLEAIQIRKMILGISHPDYISTCTDLASLYKISGKYKKAESLFLEMLKTETKEAGIENIDYATICNNLADLYKEMGLYKKAEPFFLNALKVRMKILGKENTDYIETCNGLGLLYNAMGQYKKAELLFIEALKLIEAMNGYQLYIYAETCNNLGNLFADLGQYQKAEPYYLKALGIIESVLGKEHFRYAMVCNNLGSIYSPMGQYEKAEFYYDNALEIIEKILGKEHPYYSSTSMNLAGLYKEMGQYKKAEMIELETLKIRSQTLGKEHPDYAANCENLGNLYNAMGNYDKAIQFYLEARKIKEKVVGEKHPDFILNSSNLASLYIDMGQYEKGISFTLETLKTIETIMGKRHPVYITACNNLATLYFQTNQLSKAKLFSLEAQKICDDLLGKEHQTYLTICNNLAKIYWNLKELTKADSLFNEVQTLQMGQIEKIFRFTNESEKTQFVTNIAQFQKYYFSFGRTSLSNSGLENYYNISLSNRNLILSSSQQLYQSITNSTDTTIIVKGKEWLNVKEQLAFWLAKPINERKGLDNELEEEANNLEKELTQLSVEFRKMLEQQATTWRDIQKSLKPGEASVEFVNFQFFNSRRWTDSTYYIALVLRKDRPRPELVKLFEKKQLDSALRATRQINSTLTINFRYSKSNALYNLVWQPLEKYLTGIKKIYFAPSGALYQLSLAALAKNDSEMVSDEYQLVQLNSTASVTDTTLQHITANNSDNIYLYGGVLYDGDTTALLNAAMPYNMKEAIASRSIPDDPSRGNSWQYLPGTNTEVNNIIKLAAQKNMTTHSFTGWNATEESIKSLSGKKSPAILHIATHGFFFPDPKSKKNNSIMAEGSSFRQSDNPMIRSGLILAGANYAWKNKPIGGIQDGILTSYEVSNMYLPNTKLVVLSACETGLGDIEGNEGVYGLQRAFKIAGAKNLVMSLWDVPDAETSEFMIELYKRLFAGQDIEDAFYNTQATMKKKYRNEPYKWAAWILVR